MTEGTLQLDPRSATRDDMVREAEDIMSHSPNSNVSEDESLIIDVDSDMQDIDESSCSSMAETKGKWTNFISVIGLNSIWE